VFYVTRRAKLDLTCIYFDDICEVVLTYMTIGSISVATYVYILVHCSNNLCE